MFKKIKCFFGFHKWFKYIHSERICECCKKKQCFVVYPFAQYNFPHWENFKNEKDFEENSWFKYYEGKLQYKDDLGNWYEYRRKFLEYFYPKNLRGEM